MSQILNKQQYYRLWLADELGNRPYSWGDYNALMDSPYKGLVNIRHILPGSPHMKYGVPKSKVLEYLESTGCPVHEFKFNEPLPDHRLTIQGEVSRDHRGLCLFYSQERTVMRKALQNGIQVHGLAAKMLLQKYCDPSSFEWIENLLEKYSDHIVEFSSYDTLVGTQHLNTIIWEVRKY